MPLKENRPFLGICLGAQMLVNHLGGKVEGHGDGLVEIGWYPLEATEEGKALMHWPEMVYQFHREGFSLPTGATLLATAETYPNQAFRYGDNAWGIQFHAELTRDDDAALGGARRASLRTAGRAARPRPSRRPHDLGHAPEALADRIPGDGLWPASDRLNKRNAVLSCAVANESLDLPQSQAA